MEHLLTVRIRTVEPLPDEAMIRVSLLDVSRVDLPAREVAVRRVRPHQGRLDDVVLSVPQMGAAGPDLVVQVHADLGGTGEITPGDWLTTQAYPVEQSTDVVEVDLTRI